VRACVYTSAYEDTRLLSSTYLRPHVHSATVAVAAHNSLLAHTYIPCILYIRERGDARAPTIIFFSIVFGSTSAWHFLGGRAYIYTYVQVWRIILCVCVHFVRSVWQVHDRIHSMYLCTYSVYYTCVSPRG